MQRVIDLDSDQVPVSFYAPTAMFQRRFYYAGEHQTNNLGTTSNAPSLRVWDNAQDIEVVRFAEGEASPAQDHAITCLFTHRGQLYMGVRLDPASASVAAWRRLFRVDVDTGQLTEIGIGTQFETNRSIAFGVSHMGRIFIGTTWESGTSAATLYYIREGETDFTSERTAANHTGYVTGAVYKGDLFVGTFVAANLSSTDPAAIIEKRANDGTWSTSLTGPTTGVTNYFSGLKVYGGDLYAVYRSYGGSAVTRIYKFDGTSWTIDRDNVQTTDGNVPPGGVMTDGTDLYYSFLSAIQGEISGFVLRKSGGSWSKVLTLSENSGALAFLDV